MRIYPHGRWQKRLWWAAFLVLAVAGFWLYLVATRSPINARTMIKLHEDLQHQEISRAEVEERLGGPPGKTQILDPSPKVGETVPFKSEDEKIPGTLTSYSGGAQRTPPKIGEFSGVSFETFQPLREGRPIVEVAAWDGPEGRIVVSFDADARVAGLRFQERVTWRSTLRQWLPWLP